jgi:hypothetical protein
MALSNGSAGGSAFDESKNPLEVSTATEEKPSGPLNVAPGVSGEPGDDVTSAEADEYIDGFSWRTVIGALFIGFIMLPGAIYLGLVAGQGLGPAAEWVTIILFMEVARRSYQTLKKQEIYLLYYIGANLASAGGLAGGVFSGFIWNQYLVGSPMAQSLGITNEVPAWVVPAQGSPALLNRTFMHADWLPAIGLMMFFQIFGRMNAWGLGYAVFRLTSDVERLPFPLAPIAAEGATALAESSSQKEGWRWRIFSIGAMIGVGWGVIYVLLPTVTGLVFSQPITIVTNPFIDFTSNTQKILPAAQTALGTDLGAILIGFVVPLPVVVGSFISAIGAHIFGDPILYHFGVLKTWTQGIDVTQTTVVNYFDFWLSFGGIGTSIAVAIIGIGSVFRSLTKRNMENGVSVPRSFAPPPGRGDIPIWIAMLVWFIGAMAYVGMCHYLVPNFNVYILIFFAFIWTPLFSYINARLAGMAGTHVSIPYVKEASVALSGYRGTDIWFAPIPLSDYGGMAQHFRTVELTRTKFTSIVKVELLMLPIMLVCSFLFWSFIWRLAPIPSANYPYASKLWPVQAQSQLLWFTANKDAANNVLLQSLNWNFVGLGAAFAFAVYGITILAKLPVLFFYGVINGIHGQPFGVIPMFIGGMLGRYYFSKRYGTENWRAYAPVLVAGYYCGMGLIGMAAVALALLSKSVSRLPF